jgi:hypothetical protein
VHPRRVLHGPAAPDWRGEHESRARVVVRKDRRRTSTRSSLAICGTQVTAPPAYASGRYGRGRYRVRLQTATHAMLERCPNRPLCAAVTSLPALRRTCGGSPPSSLASPPLATTAAASRNLNELARAVVRAMLGFKCRQAVMQEPRSRHLASSTAAAAQLVRPRRSSQQLGAGADDPHTERKISMRPFSTCRTSWPTPKTKHATCS